MSDGNWNYDDYMMGLGNGMELGLAIIQGKEPKYKEVPNKFKEYKRMIRWN